MRWALRIIISSTRIPLCFKSQLFLNKLEGCLLAKHTYCLPRRKTKSPYVPKNSTCLNILFTRTDKPPALRDDLALLSVWNCWKWTDMTDGCLPLRYHLVFPPCSRLTNPLNVWLCIYTKHNLFVFQHIITIITASFYLNVSTCILIWWYFISSYLNSSPHS